MNRIYLDHAATTPVHPIVAEKITSVMCATFGNPSSIHSFGRAARHVLDEARSIIADSIHAQYAEITFTSGGTEADNLAIIGSAHANKQKGKHIITTKIEHHAVLHACKYLEQEGFDVTYLAPDESGVISADAVKKALREDTILVSVMYGNNEVGTLQPIKEIGELLGSHQTLFHTDAVQAYGSLQIDVKELGVDLLSASAHKINGPKGIGFLYIKTGSKITPSAFGGEQELKRRAGTENLASIAGFAEAVQLMLKTRDEKNQKYLQYKDQLIQVLTNEKIDYLVNGTQENSLAHVLNLSFPGTDVEALLVNLDMAGIAVSSGSACTAGSIEPSHVLVAMFGPNSERVRNSVRFSFGLGNMEEEIAEAAKETAKIVHRLRR
ncbi:cysteine desulfurase family protein [Lederbergia lenta]|uniref:cysteine desulfurase n=1 Tax=Lederbergia lenta TaxID=1467 RepID=A0A2X4VYB4_LEDLE|nr:cysteine desulfurase family protein [Lederbergia lenta]MCM3111315.1 cysteine desulfurase [Lederbergia lenta]MEC2325296.1 cysteine desulfurase family protein [Lederbergia lenta]SQI55841.1 class V aminotransferase [Lederbergia lenta]